MISPFSLRMPESRTRMVNGLRVKQARELRKLTQTELARRVGVAQSTIAKMEVNVRDWPDELVEAIAIQTGFPVSFFHQGLGPEFSLGTLLFRCRASLSAADKTRLRQLGLLIFELEEKLAARTKPIELHLPSFNGENPQDAARVTRATLGLPPDTPIPHLINKLERNGIYVFALPNAADKFDAFSLWSDNDPRRPIMMVSSSKSGDRLRLNCAHEIGHLVLHKSPRGSLADLEKEAHAFAAEFMMPQEAMRHEIKAPVTLTTLADLKPRWGVSIQALIRRSYELEIISEGQYHYLAEQISKFGWRKREPSNLDIPIEKPRLFRKLAELSYGTPPNAEKLAGLVCSPVSLIEEILAVHAAKSDLPKSARDKLSSAIETFTQPDNVLSFKKTR
jgi:Zn-dependent peptidase ImmA (M78 family)/transcriptional regulator with XRE-family HTH domain